MPEVNVAAMKRHLAEISQCVSVGAIALLVRDGAGWHGSPRLNEGGADRSGFGLGDDEHPTTMVMRTRTSKRATGGQRERLRECGRYPKECGLYPLPPSRRALEGPPSRAVL